MSVETQKLLSSSVCRTCLTNKYKMRDMFKKSIYKLVKSCASVQVEKDDGLSNLICVKCIRLVIKFHNFKQECQKSDKILRDLRASVINDASVEVKTELKEEPQLQDDREQQIEYFDDIFKPEFDSEDDYKETLSDSKPVLLSTEDRNNALETDSTEVEPKHNTRNRRKIKLKGKLIKPNTNKKFANKENSKKFICDICQLEVENTKILKRHKESHSDDNPRPYVCPICLSVYHDKGYLEKHIQRHGKIKPYKCQKCNESFKYNRSLIAHLAKHDDFEPLKCSFCDMSFMIQSQLDRHRGLMHKEEAQRHVCSQCGRVFKSRCLLKTHELRHEMGDKPFSCASCDKTFASKYTLKYHQRTHGVNYIPSSTLCPLCGKNVSRLSRHMVMHSTDKPFKCDVCTKMFKSKDLLTEHKARHAEIRKYGCTVCCMRFKERRTLKSHMLIHTGEKPHQCTLCGKRFRQRGVLRTHMKVHDLH